LTHEPARQVGVSPEHWAFVVHVVPPVALGLQTPFSHEKPVAQEVVSQLARHWPSAQIFPSPHSLEYLHAFCASVHAPATHAWPFAHSVAVWHGHGPAVPPQAWHVLAMHVLPAEQSAVVVHSFAGPGFVPGAAQSPFWQVWPLAQVDVSVHVAAQPVAVHMEPGGHAALPVQDDCAGAGTSVQPYASQL
jgi:hypothetical protein